MIFFAVSFFEVSQLPEDGGVDKQKQLSCSEGALTDAELVGENSEQAVCTPQEWRDRHSLVSFRKQEFAQFDRWAELQIDKW